MQITSIDGMIDSVVGHIGWPKCYITWAQRKLRPTPFSAGSNDLENAHNTLMMHEQMRPPINRRNTETHTNRANEAFTLLITERCTSLGTRCVSGEEQGSPAVAGHALVSATR